MSLNPDIDGAFVAPRSIAERKKAPMASVSDPAWPRTLVVALSLTVALVAGACGSEKPATPVAVATATLSPTPTALSTAPSATCSQLLAANPSTDPTTLPREWSVFKNPAGVSAIVPASWKQVPGDSIVTATDPTLDQPNNMSLTAAHMTGSAPDVSTIATIEAADVSRNHADLLGSPDTRTTSLPSGPAARLSFCIPRRAADGTTVTLAILQYLIPRQTTPDGYTVYVLQELAPVEKMGYYGAIFETSASQLKLP